MEARSYFHEGRIPFSVCTPYSYTSSPAFHALLLLPPSVPTLVVPIAVSFASSSPPPLPCHFSPTPTLRPQFRPCRGVSGRSPMQPPSLHHGALFPVAFLCRSKPFRKERFGGTFWQSTYLVVAPLRLLHNPGESVCSTPAMCGLSFTRPTHGTYKARHLVCRSALRIWPPNSPQSSRVSVADQRRKNVRATSLTRTDACRLCACLVSLSVSVGHARAPSKDSFSNVLIQKEYSIAALCSR